MTVAPSTVAVVGAGLTGCLSACRLADAGHQVVLIDRRPDPRTVGVDEGRSINLAMSTRGIDALARIGLEADVRSTGVPMRGRRLHGRDGSLSFQPYGTRAEHHLLSVSRDGLNALLMEAVDRRDPITTRFGEKVVDLELEPTRLLLDGGMTIDADAIIGADGAYSIVRGRLQRTRGFDLEQDYLEHGYKELSIPATAEGGYRLDPEALHIWPRGSHMLIALPNRDGSFTCTLFWPLAGDVPFESIADAAAVRQVFEREFPDAVEHLPDLETDFLTNPVGSLITIRCSPWQHGEVLLLGDAAHAVVPFYGQGANAAMEDCTILMEALAEADSWDEAFTAFAHTRKPDTDALADLALDNYVEMRAHVTSRRFLLRQRFERLLARLLPSRFVPLYTMVTFSRTPYADAVARAQRQDRMVRWAGVAATAIVVAALAALAVALVG